MPSPVYILCAESGAIDRESQKVSVFDLIEKVQIAKITEAQKGQALVSSLGPIKIVACWLKEDSDTPEQVFEAQFFLHFPHKSEEIVITEPSEFTFSLPFWRVIISGLQLAQFFGPGILRVECRVRQKGQTPWIRSQSYPIILEEIQPPVIPPTNPPVQPTPATQAQPSRD